MLIAVKTIILSWLWVCVISKSTMTVVPPSTSLSSKGKTKFDDTVSYLSISIRRLSRGISSIFPHAIELQRLRKKLKHDLISMSYFEFKRMETYAEDLSKVFRLAITIPLSPELFFYSYFVSPLLSPSNPFAWNALPSGFDLEKDKARRQDICIQRRFYALVQALQVTRKDIIDEHNEELRMKKTNHLRRVLETLNSPSHQEALVKLSPWLFTERSESSNVRSLKVVGLGGANIKNFCRSIGVEGAPNIPLIRRLNIGDLNRYCQKV